MREVIWNKPQLKKVKRDITCNFPKLPKAGLRNQSKKKKTEVICMVKETVECVKKKEHPEKHLIPDFPKFPDFPSIPFA